MKELEKEKIDLENKIGELAVKLGKERVKNEKLKTQKNTLLHKATSLKAEYDAMKDKHENAYDQKKELYQRIREIKMTYSSALQVVQTKKLPLNLIEYKLDREAGNENKQLNISLEKNISLLVNKVIDLQLQLTNRSTPTFSRSDYQTVKKPQLSANLFENLPSNHKIRVRKTILIMKSRKNKNLLPVGNGSGQRSPNSAKINSSVANFPTLQ